MQKSRIKFDKNLVRETKYGIVSVSTENKDKNNASGKINLVNSINQERSKVKTTAKLEIMIDITEKSKFQFYIELVTFFHFQCEEDVCELTKEETEVIAVHMSQKVSTILSNAFELSTNRPVAYNLREQFINTINETE